MFQSNRYWPSIVQVDDATHSRRQVTDKSAIIIQKIRSGQKISTSDACYLVDEGFFNSLNTTETFLLLIVFIPLILTILLSIFFGFFFFFVFIYFAFACFYVVFAIETFFLLFIVVPLVVTLVSSFFFCFFSFCVFIYFTFSFLCVFMKFSAEKELFGGVVT
jgi:hypothetical protein